MCPLSPMLLGFHLQSLRVLRWLASILVAQQVTLSTRWEKRVCRKMNFIRATVPKTCSGKCPITQQWLMYKMDVKLTMGVNEGQQVPPFNVLVIICSCKVAYITCHYVIQCLIGNSMFINAKWAIMFAFTKQCQTC